MISIYTSRAFTIVEMMVVVAVLGILVSISTFGYRGWQQGIEQRQLKSDLIMASTALENSKNFGAGYPTSIPTNFSASSGVNMTYVSGNAATYCIQAQSAKTPTVRYFINKSQGASPQAGVCPAAVVLGVPTISYRFASGANTSINWNAASGAVSYQVQWRQNGGAWTNVQLAAGVLSYNRNGSVPATNEYQVRSVAADASTSAWSSIVSVSTFSGPAWVSGCNEQSFSAHFPAPSSSTIPEFYIYAESGYDGEYEDYPSNPFQSGGTYTWDAPFWPDTVVVYYINNLGHQSTGTNGTFSVGQGGSCLE